jgi:hypothetical protein
MASTKPLNPAAPIWDLKKSALDNSDDTKDGTSSPSTPRSFNFEAQPFVPGSYHEFYTNDTNSYPNNSYHKYDDNNSYQKYENNHNSYQNYGYGFYDPYAMQAQAPYQPSFYPAPTPAPDAFYSSHSPIDPADPFAHQLHQVETLRAGVYYPVPGEIQPNGEAEGRTKSKKSKKGKKANKYYSKEEREAFRLKREQEGKKWYSEEEREAWKAKTAEEKEEVKQGNKEREARKDSGSGVEVEVEENGVVGETVYKDGEGEVRIGAAE